MAERLKNRYYCHKRLFIADMTRIFTNCRSYNKPDTEYYKCANTLEKFVMGKLKDAGLVEKWTCQWFNMLHSSWTYTYIHSLTYTYIYIHWHTHIYIHYMLSLLFILVNESRCCEKFYSRINDTKVQVLISCYFLVPKKLRFVYARSHIGCSVSVNRFRHFFTILNENMYTCQICTIKTNV